MWGVVFLIGNSCRIGVWCGIIVEAGFGLYDRG
jgi:hypothetical protein